MWCDSIHLVCSDLCMWVSASLKVGRVLCGMCHLRKMADMCLVKLVMCSVNCQYRLGKSTESVIIFIFLLFIYIFFANKYKIISFTAVVSLIIF